MDNIILTPELLTGAIALTTTSLSLGRHFNTQNILAAFANRRVTDKDIIEFRPITPETMPIVWSFIEKEPGRTTDFSYGGILMWIDYFKYEYAIVNDTLFIKGRVETDISKVAYSLPVGKMTLHDSITLLQRHCKASGEVLRLSAVPQYAIDEIETLVPEVVEEITDWEDYLYDASTLANLTGKKMSKKRNHVNQFLKAYPDWKLEPLTKENAHEAIKLMDLYDLEGDSTPMAILERSLSRFMIDQTATGNPNLIGALLKADDNYCAFTIADIKEDTLFIHVEKALRGFPGSFEMINKAFAADMLDKNPDIKFINREDDGGDEGLRYAKMSYHPIEKLKKYNVVFD